jgi:glycosyltransferase involved in cell wall biosynthesis
MLSVSAVIPVYNGGAFVGEAINSVLNQTYPPVECLVIDDGSTDSTPEIVAGFGDAVFHVRQERRGVSAARNRGAKLARGDLLAFLDHDDTWFTIKLERQVAALEVAEDATMALCAMQVVDAGGNVLGMKRLRPRDDLITGMLLIDGTETVSCSSTGVVRRDAFLDLGGFDVALGMSADWDLLLRTLLHSGVEYVDEPLVNYRVHDSNMSRTVSAMDRDMRYAFAKAFADPSLPDSVRERRRKAYGRLYRMLGASYHESGHTVAAGRLLVNAILHDPTIALELIRGFGRRPSRCAG